MPATARVPASSPPRAPSPPARRAAAIVEERRDASRQVAAIRHAEDRARLGVRQPPRQQHQLIGVVGPIGRLEHGVVGRALRFEAETPPRGPHQRMEPVARADSAGRELHHPVVAAHMLQLVHDRAADVGVAPRARVARQHDGRTPQPAGEGGRDRLVLEDLDGPPDAGLRGQRAGQRADIREWDTAAADAADARNRHDQRGETGHGADHPDESEDATASSAPEIVRLPAPVLTPGMGDAATATALLVLSWLPLF